MTISEYFPRPIKDILNYFIYKSYVKKFDLNTKSGKKCLRELQRQIELFGFNEGIIGFDKWYRREYLPGVKLHITSSLKSRAKEYDFEQQRREFEKDLILPPIRNKKKPKKVEIPEAPYDPSWKPTKKELNRYNPVKVREPYVGLKKIEYHVREKGAYVIVLELHGQVKEVLVGKSALYVGDKASDRCEFYARLYNLKTEEELQKESEKQKSKKQKVVKEEDDFDIDISHVNRIMGNDRGNNRMNNNNDDDDINRLLDDIF